MGDARPGFKGEESLKAFFLGRRGSNSLIGLILHPKCPPCPCGQKLRFVHPSRYVHRDLYHWRAHNFPGGGRKVKNLVYEKIGQFFEKFDENLHIWILKSNLNFIIAFIFLPVEALPSETWLFVFFDVCNIFISNSFFYHIYFKVRETVQLKVFVIFSPNSHWYGLIAHQDQFIRLLLRLAGRCSTIVMYW